MEEQRCKSCEWWDSWYNECTHPEMPQGDAWWKEAEDGADCWLYERGEPR